MRILHVTDGYRPHLGGIEVFVEDLAARQAQLGHEVSVLTATPADGESDASAVRVVRTRRTLRHPLAPPRAKQTALAGAYDVVHAHVSVLSPFASTVARMTDEAGIATVSTVHSMWGGRGAIVRGVRVLSDWDRSTIAWTAVSQAAAADMRAVLHPRTQVEVVPNAVDVDWWHRGPRLPPSTGPVTFVSVMRLAARKRPFALLDMVERARETLPVGVELHVLLVGDGPLADRVRAEVAARGLGDDVSLLGRRTREEIRALYDDADVYVSPAYQESFGIAALEARAAGLPVVAMRAGGVGEFVVDGVDGLLCGDDAEMTAALTSLAADPSLRHALTAHNARVPPTQDWPRTLADFDDVYWRVRRASEARRRRASATAPQPTT